MGLFGGKKKSKKVDDSEKMDVNITAVDMKEQLLQEIEKVKEKRNKLGDSIEHNESKRRRLMVKLEQLHETNNKLVERLAKRKEVKKEYEKTIRETDSANKQMAAETHALLHKLKMDMIDADFEQDQFNRRSANRKKQKDAKAKVPISRELEREESNETASDDSSF